MIVPNMTPQSINQSIITAHLRKLVFTFQVMTMMILYYKLTLTSYNASQIIIYLKQKLLAETLCVIQYRT